MPSHYLLRAGGAPAPADRLDAFQLSSIREALELRDGSWAAAARDLGMHRSNLYHLAERLGLAAPKAGRVSASPPTKNDGPERPTKTRRKS